MNLDAIIRQRYEARAIERKRVLAELDATLSEVSAMTKAAVRCNDQYSPERLLLEELEVISKSLDAATACVQAARNVVAARKQAAHDAEVFDANFAAATQRYLAADALQRDH
ncbi:MAG: hypothetical protein ACYCYN_03135 [Solirubrobacteraceae bacterium]